MEAKTIFGIDCISEAPEPGQYDGIVLAVGHEQFIAMSAKDIRALGRKGAVLFDVKGVLPKDESDGRL